MRYAERTGGTNRTNPIPDANEAATRIGARFNCA